MFSRGFCRAASVSQSRHPAAPCLPHHHFGRAKAPFRSTNEEVGDPLAHYILWLGMVCRQTVAKLGLHQRIFYTYTPDFVLDLKRISSRGFTPT